MVGVRRLLITTLVAMAASACTGSESTSLSSSAASTTAAPSTNAPSTIAPSTIAPSTTERPLETTTAEPSTSSSSTTSTTVAVSLRSVINPLWNPYDSDDFGEEFPSITALGEVPQPDAPHDILSAEVYGATAGATDRPLGAGCSPGDDTLGDGIWAGGIAAAGPDSITIDIVCLFPQQEDMFIAPNGMPCTGPFESADPCMTNSSALLRELAVSPSVEIVVARLLEPTSSPSADADLAPTTHVDFLTYLELGTYTPFLVEVRDGVVVRIEQYRSLWLPGL